MRLISQERLASKASKEAEARVKRRAKVQQLVEWQLKRAQGKAAAAKDTERFRQMVDAAQKAKAEAQKAAQDRRYGGWGGFR